MSINGNNQNKYLNNINVILNRLVSKLTKIMLISENDGRYCVSEKFVHDETAYITCLKSAKEFYGEPLRRMDILSLEEYDLLFEHLLKVADECYQINLKVSRFSRLIYWF